MKSIKSLALALCMMIGGGSIGDFSASEIISPDFDKLALDLKLKHLQAFKQQSGKAAIEKGKSCRLLALDKDGEIKEVVVDAAGNMTEAQLLFVENSRLYVIENENGNLVKREIKIFDDLQRYLLTWGIYEDKTQYLMIDIVKKRIFLYQIIKSLMEPNQTLVLTHRGGLLFKINDVVAQLKNGKIFRISVKNGQITTAEDISGKYTDAIQSYVEAYRSNTFKASELQVKLNECIKTKNPVFTYENMSFQIVGDGSTTFDIYEALPVDLQDFRFVKLNVYSHIEFKDGLDFEGEAYHKLRDFEQSYDALQIKDPQQPDDLPENGIFLASFTVSGQKEKVFLTKRGGQIFFMTRHAKFELAKFMKYSVESVNQELEISKRKP